MNVRDIILDTYEVSSKTIVSCDCGDDTRDFDDADAIGAISGTCVRCGRPKVIQDIVPSGKIPLFSHVLVKHLKENKIPYSRMALSATGGDYIVQSAKRVIERKTVGDLIHTWLQGDPKGKLRLEHQIQLCLTSYPDAKVSLLIEDYYNAILDFANRCIWIPTYDNVKQSQRGSPFRQMGYYKIGVNPNSLLGKLEYLEEKIDRAANDPRDAYGRLEIVKCSGAAHALEWFLKEISGVDVTAPKAKRLRINRIKRGSTDVRESQLFFLEGLPEIGPVSSNKLLNAYGTPKIALERIDEWKNNPALKIKEPALLRSKQVLGIPLTEEERRRLD